MWKVETDKEAKEYVLRSAMGMRVLVAPINEYATDRDDKKVDQVNEANLESLKNTAAVANALIYDILRKMMDQLKQIARTPPDTKLS